MSKACRAVTLLLLITTLAGCTNANENIHEKIHSRYYNMPSYTAKCNVTINSNKTKNTYSLNVTYDSGQHRCRMDYDNMSIILGETNAQIKKDNTVMSVPVDDSHMIVMLNTFFRSYYEGENASMTTGASANAGSTMLSCDIVNPPKFAKSMKLWIDNKTVTPTAMNIYDAEGNEKICIEFTEFKILSNIEESIFEF